MRLRRLGSSDLAVSEISLGSWLTYGSAVEREQGVLTGKYRPGEAPPPGSRAATDETDSGIDTFFRDEVLEGVERLRPIADGFGISLAQLALAWVLREPNVASAIVGASRLEQVEQNAAASGIELDGATLAELDSALAGPVPA